ncbi:hypothetical protein CR513_43650, partial [Mucuna pruriens]
MSSDDERETKEEKVPRSQGAEGKLSGNVISGDKDSLPFAKDIAATLRILYGGSEDVPGNFSLKGGDGRIITSYLSSPP